MIEPRPRSSHPGNLLPRLLLALLFVWPAVMFLAPPVSGQETCDRAGCGPIRQGNNVVCFTPAKPAPANLWGELQPVDPSPLPAERDTTNFNEVTQNYASRNWFNGVDVENGWVLAGLAHGIGIWDARTNPASPTYVTAKRWGPSQPFPYIPAGESSKIVFGGIDAPEGNDKVAAIVGYNGAGILVFDLNDKSSPKPVYQDYEKTGESVYAKNINGTNYAFFPSSLPGGVFIYNLDRAVASNGCQESTSSPSCAGVRVGQISTPGTPYFVHGVGNYLAVSFGSSRGLQIYDVSNPASPQVRLTAFTGTTGRPVQGIAMWQEGANYFLAVRLGVTKTQSKAETAIYNVNCVTSGCSGLGNPLWIEVLNTNSGSEYITFSRSGTRPFLYVGGDGSCASDSGDIQREWLFDVSNPAGPDEVTVGSPMTVTAPYNGVNVTKQVNYWTWYYRASATGFNLVAPRTGKFVGDYFYRAARSLMDIHKLAGNLPPAADFTWSPTEVYPGTPVTFTDRSSGAPTQWTWTFQDGSPASSFNQNPQVAFATAGTKVVSLTPGNGAGPGTPVAKNITVLDPAPQIGAVTVSPAAPLVCQAVSLGATGATGQAPLGYSWVVKSDATNLPVPVNNASTSTPTLNTVGLQSGSYTATLTLSNGVGSASKSTTFNLAALTPLAFSGANGAPENDAFTAGTVKFHARSVGATEWNWDFGDGQGFRGWSDATSNADPTVSYLTPGTKTVQVKIRNCVQAEIASATLQINVTQTTPLQASFQATLFCQFGQCFGTAGEPITFTDSSTGAELYDYDWNHTGQSAANCNFTDANHTSAVATHTYSTPGVFSPCLRVRRGASEQSVTVHGAINVGSAGGGPGPTNPSISVSGPSAGNLNQSYTFSATPSNCTANSTGWNWNTGGGSVSGDANGSTVTVSWSTTGSKTVSATNTGCSGAQGVRNISITDPGNNGGGNPNGPLQAAFTFTPSAPKPGETVSFNGASSSGSPATYAWDFGDGQTAGGATATHAYAAAGSYVVRLTITKPGIGAGCFLGTCISELTKTVVVGNGTTVTPLSTEFTASVACANQFGFEQCQAETGKAVTLTAAAENATSYLWEFGDGTTGTGRSVTKTWPTPNSYSVTLVVSNGQSTLQKTKIFIVSGAAPAASKSVVLPWIAQTRGALDQSSDLYVHNPGTTAMEITLEFRKRGLPESNPPQEKRTIPPGATLYVGDALDELFERENIAGFISVKVDKGDAEPVITSFNTTFQADGKQFGQTVSGVSMSRLGAAASAGSANQVQSLVGLINNDERLTYFGISNPSDQSSTYHLRFYDKDGKMVSESPQDLTVSRYSQRQYQAKELDELFGISDLADYRVEIETKAGGTVIPYASNLRLASEDPSYIEPGSAKSSKVYLLGVLSAPGLNDSTWQSDVVLSNTSAQQIQADVTFTSVGLTSTPTTPLRVTLPPGKTERLENVVASQWNIRNGIGVLTIASTAPAGIFPVVQGESYENTNPAKRFGQAMTAFSESDAAGAGKGQYLVGLRQDATHRTTLWLFNPGTDRGVYDVVYRALDGTVIGTTKDVALGGGKMRQLSPGQHPLPAAGAKDGFTVQIVVKEGKVLSAAQVINNATNDPAYIKGEVR
ncbi:MAG TPA: PKD domain-containing protein [Thermoanaerobaculia bacterium]